MQCPGYPKVWSFADDLSKWHPVSTEAWRWEAGLNQNLNVSVVCTTSFLCIASMLGCDTMNFQQTCSRHTVGSWVPRQGVVCAWRLNQAVWNRWIEQPPHTTEPTGKGAAGEWLPLAVAEQRASGAHYVFLSLEMNTELSDSVFHVVRWSVSRPCHLFPGDGTRCSGFETRKTSG